MRILFFSDFHGNNYTAENFFRDLQELHPDRVIFGGDVMGYYYGSDGIIDMLRRYNVTCLLGNHDRMFLDVLDGTRTEESLIKKYGNSYLGAEGLLKEDNVQFLRSLSPKTEITEGSLRMVFIHGSVVDPLNGRIYPDTVINDPGPYSGIDYVFCGHTHHKMEKHIGKTTIINPGSIGQQRDGKGCTFLMFDTDTREYALHEVSYDIESLVRDIDVRESDPAMKKKLTEVLYRKPDYRQRS